MGPREGPSARISYAPFSMDKLKPSESDRKKIRAKVGFKFGEVLWTRLRDVILKSDGHWVTPEEYELYFNTKNNQLGYGPLDTGRFDLVTFFLALDNIFDVKYCPHEVEPIRLYLVPDFHARAQRAQQISRTSSSSASRSPPSAKSTQERREPSLPRMVPIRKNFTDAELKKILQEFNTTLGYQQALGVQEYLTRLDKAYPGSKGAIELRTIAINRDIINDYLVKFADPAVPVIRISDQTLSVGDPTDAPTFTRRYPYCSVFTERKPWPVNTKAVFATVNEVHTTPRNLYMFITTDDDVEKRRKLQSQLELDYGRKRRPAVDRCLLRRGLPCAVPFESTQDYHRAVVVRPVMANGLVRVLYVDFGTVADVACQSVVALDQDYWVEPVLAEPAVLSFSIPWSKRSQAASDVQNRRVKFVVLDSNEKRGAMVVRVEDLVRYAAGPNRLRERDAAISRRNNRD